MKKPDIESKPEPANVEVTQGKTLITDLFYLPNVEYFSLLKDCKKICIPLSDKYVKQTYRNRCDILLANKIERLSVPVLQGRKGKPMKEIKIDYGQKWLNVHLRGIQSAYGKAPYFDYLYPDLEEVFLRKHRHLWQLNVGLLTKCLQFLQMPAIMVMSDNLDDNCGKNDLRGAFDTADPDLDGHKFVPQPYLQVFGVDFVPNLSIVDLLFCEGPNAIHVLEQSVKKKLNNT